MLLPQKNPVLLVTCCCVLFLVAVSSAALPDLAAGSPFNGFFWTQAEDGGVRSGCYGHLSIDGEGVNSSGATRYPSTFWLESKYDWWKNFFPGLYLSSSIIINEDDPPEIINKSEHLSDCAWFRGFERTDSAGYALQFLFPLLPQNEQYGRYDYFTVKVDDTLNLEFYGAGDSIMAGSFVHKDPDSNGVVRILARNAFVVELTKSNPLRIKSIRCNAEFEEYLTWYLKYDLKKLKNGVAWYGMDFIDTSVTIPKPYVGDITVAGPFPLVSGTTHKISWTPGDISAVDSFIVEASFDSMQNWSRTGRVIADSSFIWTVPNRSSGNSFIKVTAYGHFGDIVSSVSDRFTTEIPAGFRLRAQSYAASSILVSWNPSVLSTPRRSALCIAYRTGSIVSSITDGTFDTLMYDLDTEFDTIKGLTNKGMWYFTAFVKDSSGAFSLPGAGATDSAMAEDLTAPENPFILEGTSLDSTSIRLSWHSDNAVSEDIDSIGIWINEFRFPSQAYDEGSNCVGFPKISANSDTVLDLKSSTTYYIAMFVADSLGNWSASTPHSLIQVRTPSASGETDEGHIIHVSGADTQSVFSDTIKVWSNVATSVYVDTIDSWTPPPLEGFIIVGPLFSLRSGTLSSRSSLSFKVKTGDVPNGYSVSDVRLYRYNIYTGGWRIGEGGCAIDSFAGTITFTTNDAELPFAVMIDTVEPVITYNSNDTAAYAPNQAVVDTVFVEDNIENCTVRLLAAPGHLGYSDISLYAVEGSEKGQYITTIPAYVADPVAGLRSMVRVSDGKSSVSVNTSRKILRTSANCDDVITDALNWTPLFVTAQPQKSRMSDIMSASTNGQWGYDKSRERIIQWLPDSTDKNSNEKWVEYDNEIDSLFEFAPGKLFWIKKLEPLNIKYGSAVIPALTDTVEIVLKKGEWTDFSMPFNFDIYSGDIFSATNSASSWASDSIEIYHWNATNNSFSTDPKFLPGIRDLTGRMTIFEGAEPFTAFNTSGRDVVLRIPPTCLPISTISEDGSLAKKNSGRSWSVRVSSFDCKNRTLPPIYCAGGFRGGPEGRLYSMPPAFLPVTAGIFDETSGRRFGHSTKGVLDTGGYVFRIDYCNSGNEADQIISRIEKTSGLPSDFSARIFTSNERRPQSPSDSNNMTISAGGKSSSYLIVGTARFIDDFVRKITSIFSFCPVTVNGALRIQYTLPMNVHTLMVSIYDLKGRRVDQIVRTANISAGAGSFVWNRGTSAGYYIVEMRALINGSNKPLKMSRKWLYVR